jgi:hypothetical protein
MVRRMSRTQSAALPVYDRYMKGPDEVDRRLIRRGRSVAMPDSDTLAHLDGRGPAVGHAMHKDPAVGTLTLDHDGLSSSIAVI